MIACCIVCEEARQPGSLFCRTHETAPASQRGGWLSAERRRRKMAAHQDQRLDASNVATRLWVGGRPPFDHDLPDFDVLVLCAQELQPATVAFHGRVLRCPIPDSSLDRQELAMAVLTAKDVGDALLTGQRALVTCAMGLNRSALVASLALARATRMTANEIISRIRQRRNASALHNPHFQEIIRRLVRR